MPQGGRGELACPIIVRMCRASLAALALVSATLLSACGVRYSGSYSSGSTFTTSFPDPNLPNGTVGSFSADYSFTGYNARSFGAALTLDAELKLDDYDLSARIFQDLNGDGQYSPSADRLLAISGAANRDSGSRELSLQPIQFTFHTRHEPVGISWVIHGPDEKQYTEDRMFR